MPVNLSIKQVPDEWAERLRVRAERNHRSLQGELMALVERAALESEPPPRGSWASRGPGVVGIAVCTGSKTVEELHAEHLIRFPKPIDGGPLAVDIIRADRDSR